jgi:hypothetical protein
MTELNYDISELTTDNYLDWISQTEYTEGCKTGDIVLNDNDKIDLSSLIITPNLIKNDICVICFCQLNDTVIQTTCNHQYHLHCITQWYQIKNLCPLCKNVI